MSRPSWRKWLDRAAGGPGAIALIYAVTGAAWIAFSDRLVAALFVDPRTLSWAQTLKGWLFVAVTAALLYYLIARSTQALRRSERELRESQRVLSTLMSNLPGMVYRCRNDRDWTMEFVSEGCYRLTGYRPEDLLENRRISYGDLVHPEDRSAVWESVQESVRRGESFEGSYRILTADGSERWVWEQGRGVRSEDGSIRIEGFIIDISGQVAAEERYRTLFEESKDAIYVTTREGRVIDANPAMLALFGCSREQILAVNVKDLYVDPEDRESFQEEIETRGSVGEYEVRLRRMDGEEMDCLLSATTWSDGSGRILGYQGVIRDVTKKRAAERALRRSEERLRTVVTGAPIVFFALDREGIFTLSEGRGLEALGLEPGEVVGRSVLDVYGEFPEVLQNVRRALEGEEFTAAVEVGGLVFETRYAPTRDERGTVTGVVGVATNVSDRVEAERKRSRLAEILEATPDLVEIATPDGQVLYRNVSARRLLGIDPSGSTSAMTVWDAHPENWNRILREEAIPTAMREGVWRGETVFRARDGREFPASQVMIAHQAPGGEATLLSTVARDISEQKALEEQLRQSQKLEAIGRLAGGIAHDFNNLLTAILGNCELLLRETNLSDHDREGLQEIQQAAGSAARLTRQLLAFSRRQVLRPRPVDLNEIIEKMTGMLSRLLGEDVELVTRPGTDLWSVEADPGQIEQVLMNLAVNARDAMPQGGSLVIETANVELDERYVSRHPVARPGRYVRLAISDTGAGMDEETRSRVFEPFFTTKPKGEGTGLGLSTVYGIVKQSGGYVWTYSEPGRGTTFKIYLPRVEAKALPASRSDRHGAIDGSETVLLVEDEAALRRPLRRGLERFGYRVFEAADGPTALDICTRQGSAVDIMVTDVVMPGMNGRQLADRVSELHPAMRILFMSGYADEAIVHHGVLDPGVAFLEKPFSPRALAQKIREVLENAS